MADSNGTLFLQTPVHRQRGQALLVLLLLLVVAGSAVFYSFAGSANSAIERDKITAAALAQAKAALIGYAAAVDLSGAGRPGDLPCPDRDNDGFAAVPADYPCSGGALGRLPWKTLGLPDLRDGDGERLWYAVSSNFKNGPRTVCTAPGDAGCLNSDSRGTITVRNSSGTVINDGSNPDPFTPSGVVAVIFAPGAVLQRQDTGATQDRSCAGGSCTDEVICTSSPATATPKCNPVNYLDIRTGVEDNADFVDGSNSNGFISGTIRDANGNPIVNDRLLVITYEDLMPVLQRRVAKEVINCLTLYASEPQNSGRYPWAAPVANYPSYADQVNVRFGRVPDAPLNDTLLGTGGWPATTICPLTPSLCMSSSWPSACSIAVGSWWTNWKDMVFYGVAAPYAPASPTWGWTWGPVPPSGGCGGNCLVVNPPSPNADKRIVVAVAGKRLSDSAYSTGNDQPRVSTSDKQDPRNYLEGTNDNPPSANTYEQQPISSSFSDFLLYQ